MGRKQSKAFQDLQNLQPTEKKGKFKIRRQKDSHLDDFAKELKQIYPDMEMFKRGDGDFKTSEILWLFLAPEKPLIQEDLEKGHFLVNIAVTAWNLSLLPEKEREEKIDDFLGIMNIQNDFSLRNSLLEFLEIFIERKLEYFSEFDIFISHFKLEEVGNELRLSVASTTM